MPTEVEVSKFQECSTIVPSSIKADKNFNFFSKQGANIVGKLVKHNGIQLKKTLLLRIELDEIEALQVF